MKDIIDPKTMGYEIMGGPIASYPMAKLSREENRMLKIKKIFQVVSKDTHTSWVKYTIQN